MSSQNEPDYMLTFNRHEHKQAHMKKKKKNIIYKLMKYNRILLKYHAYFQKLIFSRVKYKTFFIFQCHRTELLVKHYTTKCKICFSF